jgi:hypothetical protein
MFICSQELSAIYVQPLYEWEVCDIDLPHRLHTPVCLHEPLCAYIQLLQLCKRRKHSAFPSMRFPCNFTNLQIPIDNNVEQLIIKNFIPQTPFRVRFAPAVIG